MVTDEERGHVYKKTFPNHKAEGAALLAVTHHLSGDHSYQFKNTFRKGFIMFHTSDMLLLLRKTYRNGDDTDVKS